MKLCNSLRENFYFIAKGDHSKMAEKRCYTVKEIQEMLGICRVTVYALLKKGKFPYVKVGGKYLVSKKYFDEWLESSGQEQKSFVMKLV